ncbi:mpv17-like protein isoform X1 [Syngnathoides biaculeatus]|uniref:mpv17-like protein isoform X1 n=1 Tax=Syngnathoides biaculeatus TaxID=300417 RepID=UPI002ADDC73C|nr:mpv17-like protein isoform X1 [Syngnathoides biaculeatus]
MSRVGAAFRAHPYISNVVGYTALFASADLFQQRVLGRRDASRAPAAAPVDWRQTARVATVGFCFHANFNYQWLRWLERVLPGGGVRAVTGKVVLDQLVGAPLTITAFYIGLSLLENNDDLLADWKEKFWPSYKTGVVFWSTMQWLGPCSSEASRSFSPFTCVISGSRRAANLNELQTAFVLSDHATTVLFFFFLLMISNSNLQGY